MTSPNASHFWVIHTSPLLWPPQTCFAGGTAIQRAIAGLRCSFSAFSVSFAEPHTGAQWRARHSSFTTIRHSLAKVYAHASYVILIKPNRKNYYQQSTSTSWSVNWLAKSSNVIKTVLPTWQFVSFLTKWNTFWLFNHKQPSYHWLLV